MHKMAARDTRDTTKGKDPVTAAVLNTMVLLSLEALTGQRGCQIWNSFDSISRPEKIKFRLVHM